MVLRAHDLEVNLLSRRVVRDGQEIDLTRREFELLEYLLRHKNATVTRDMIARDVWKEPSVVWTNVADVYIKTLRKKIERPNNVQLIHTIRGVGYALRDDPWNHLSIRWRLTIWYSTKLAIILLVSGTGLYYLMSFHLMSRLDRDLTAEPRASMRNWRSPAPRRA